MPAAAGSGLLFELCHDGMPLALMEALEGGGGHAHHLHAGHAPQAGHDAGHAGHHGGHHTDTHAAHDAHGAVGHCGIGHLLSMVFLDTDVAMDFQARSMAGLLAAEPVARLLVFRRYAPAPRGPPLA